MNRRGPICMRGSPRTSDGRPRLSQWRPRRRVCASRCWWCMTRTTMSRPSRRGRRSRPRFRTRRCGAPRAWDIAARYATPTPSSASWNSCAPSDLARLETRAEKSFRTFALEVEQERLVVVMHVEIDAHPAVTETERKVRAPAKLHVGVGILVPAIGGVVDQFELVVANVERPTPGDAPGKESGAAREDACFGVFLVIDGARLTTFGSEIENGEAEPQAPFEPVGLDGRVRIVERQRAPVELGTESVAGVKIEITEADGVREDHFAEAIELEVVDAHVVALAHAQVELHASLVHHVVETEVVFTAQHSTVGRDRAGRIDAHHRGDVTLEIGAAHPEMVVDRARDLVRLGLEHFARLENGLGFFLAWPVFNGFFAILAHDGTPDIQYTKQTDERQAHSQLLTQASSP